MKNSTDLGAGFSPQSLWLMRQFYPEYHSEPALQKLTVESPWRQNILRLQRVNAPAARLYCLRATAQSGWSRNLLVNQMKNESRRLRAGREGKENHNFPFALREQLAEQADEMRGPVFVVTYRRLIRC